MTGLGIDTGGTCTDAVIYCTETKKVLASAKTQTTHSNLKDCILAVINMLPEKLLLQTDFIALSTTLATNACVEGKGGKAKLIFIGMTEDEIRPLVRSYGLPSANEIFCVSASIPMDAEHICPPDWAQFRKDIRSALSGYDSAAVTQLNARINGGDFEQTARRIITEECGIPCIAAFELFQEYDVYRRGASALLNARLLPVIHTFLDSMRCALKQKGLDRPIVIVRSDGTVMSTDYACEHPVETLLCGPAASIRGAMELCPEKNAVIIDMGGTTSDVALVKNGIPVTVTEGVQIGSWKTFVQGMFIDTFGLGGDSTICRTSSGELYLDTMRSIPLCQLAEQFPQTVHILRDMNQKNLTHSRNIYEFLVLIRNVPNDNGYSETEKELCRNLYRGPMPISQAAESVGKDIYTLDIRKLLSENVVMRSALTPTDLMHVRGDFRHFNADASREALCILARSLHASPESICDDIYRMVKKKLYMNILRILMKDSFPHQKDKLLDQVDFLYEQAYEAACGQNTPFFTPSFQIHAKLIGVGAPAHIFIPDTARLLGVNFEIPDLAPVANALGAASGNITASATVEIRESASFGKASVFYFSGRPQAGTFHTLEDARKAARTLARQDALKKAVLQGAGQGFSIHFESIPHVASTDFGKLFLSEEITACVIAKASFCS